MDLVSIIIPVYNTGKYLSGCLDSCLKQTYQNLEIIVLDDHSTDPLTCELLQKYQNIDPRLKVIFSEENRGQGYRRNEGLKHIHGKYFAYIDSDDTFVPNAIEHLHNTIVQYQTDFVQSDVHNIDAEDVIVDRLGFTSEALSNRCRDLFNYKGEPDKVQNLPELIQKGLIFSVPALCYGKLFNTEKYLQAQILFDDGPYSRHCQDEDWSTSMLLKLNSFVYTKFVSIVRFILRESASAPSVKYYKCAIAAASRRYHLLHQPDLSGFYGNSVTEFAVQRINFMVKCIKERQELPSLAQFATEFLQDFHEVMPFSLQLKQHFGLTSHFQTLTTRAFPNRPTIMYFSLQSILDTTDPEVLAVRCMLEHMAAKGFSVCVLSGHLTLKAKGDVFADKNLFSADSSFVPVKLTSNLTQSFFNGIYYCKVDLSCHNLAQFNLLRQDDLNAISAAFKYIFSLKVPDVLLYSGADPLSQSIARLFYRPLGALEALAANGEKIEPNTNLQSLQMPICYIPLHARETEPFPCCHMITAFTEQQAQCYSQRKPEGSPVQIKTLGYTPFPTWNLNVKSFGALTLREQYQTLGSSLATPAAVDSTSAPESASATATASASTTTPADTKLNPVMLEIDRQRPQGTITMFYPDLDQGLAVVIALIMHYAEHNPQLKFVIVNNPAAGLASNLAALHNKEGKTLSQLNPNLSKLKIISFNEPLEPVYRDTRLMLHFPVYPQPDSMQPMYACWQGIKVLTSDQHQTGAVLKGSIPAKLQAQAFAEIKLPESTQQDPSCLPSATELEPIVQAMDQLLASPHVALSYEQQREQITQSVQAWHDTLLGYMSEIRQQPVPQLYHLV